MNRIMNTGRNRMNATATGLITLVTLTALAATLPAFAQKEKSTVSHYAGPRQDAAVPRPGMRLENGRVALVVIDPQNDFLHPKGVAWGVVGESVKENNTVENIEVLLRNAKSSGVPVFVSPHYYYPHDHKWQFSDRTRSLDCGPSSPDGLTRARFLRSEPRSGREGRYG